MSLLTHEADRIHGKLIPFYELTRLTGTLIYIWIESGHEPDRITGNLSNHQVMNFWAETRPFYGTHPK